MAGHYNRTIQPSPVERWPRTPGPGGAHPAGRPEKDTSFFSYL